MIINKINLGHVQRNADEQYLVTEVLNAIYTQREEAYSHALIYAEYLSKWADESEINNLTLAYETALKQLVKQQKKMHQAQCNEENKLIYVEFDNRKVALFKINFAINKVMSVQNIEKFIEEHRSKLCLPDLEQSTGVLYALALSKCKQARVKNNV